MQTSFQSTRKYTVLGVLAWLLSALIAGRYGIFAQLLDIYYFTQERSAVKP